MKDYVYTIKKLCQELDQPRQKIRRRLIKLGIKAVNEDSRAYKNVPLKYDYQAFLTLAEEFNVSVRYTEFIASEKKRSTDEQNCTEANEQHNTENLSKDKIIKVLEEQLKESNKSRENLEKLLDQQQQLTLMSNRELEMLKLKTEEVSKEKEVKKSKWYDIFKKNI